MGMREHEIRELDQEWERRLTAADEAREAAKSRKRVRQGDGGQWVILDGDGKRVLPGRSYLTPAEALEAARRVIELERLLLEAAFTVEVVK